MTYEFKFRGIESGGVELGFVHDNRQEDEMRLGCSELKTFMTFESGNGEGTVGDLGDGSRWLFLLLLFFCRRFLLE